MKRSNRSTPIVGIGAALLSLGAAACSGEATPTDSVGNELAEITEAIALENLGSDTDSRLVARVEVQPNEMLEFYELAPGIIGMSNAGAPDAPMRISQADLRLAPRDLWDLATEGAPMTAELEAAVERAEQRRRVRLDAAASPKADVPAPARKAMAHQPAGVENRPSAPAFAAASAGFCDTGFLTSSRGNCTLEDGEGHPDVNIGTVDFSVCLDNHWNGAYGSSDDVWYGYTNVCAAQNSQVQLEVDGDEFSGVIWTVPLNTFREFYVWDSACDDSVFDDCTSMRADVTHASGDRFHFRYFIVDYD